MIFIYFQYWKTLACAAQASFWYWSCFDALPNYTALWSELYHSVNCKDCPITPRGKAWMLMVMSLSLILLSEAIGMYLLINTELMDLMVLPLTREHVYWNVGVTLTICLLLFENACWILPVIVYFMMTSSITISFTNLNNELQKSVNMANTTGQPPGKELQKSVDIVNTTGQPPGKELQKSVDMANTTGQPPGNGLVDCLCMFRNETEKKLVL